MALKGLDRECLSSRLKVSGMALALGPSAKFTGLPGYKPVVEDVPPFRVNGGVLYSNPSLCARFTVTSTLLEKLTCGPEKQHAVSASHVAVNWAEAPTEQAPE